MKSFEEKEAKLRPNWYNSLGLPNWQKDHPAMSWDFPKEPVPIVAALGKFEVEDIFKREHRSLQIIFLLVIFTKYNTYK